jgi:hypothetical protein
VPIFILLIVAALLIAGGALYYIKELGTNTRWTPTREPKRCPAGSYVGRVGWNYESACPTIQSKNVIQHSSTSGATDTSNWKTYRDEQSGFEVKYPQDWAWSGPYTNEASPIVFVFSPIASSGIRIYLTPEIDLGASAMMAFRRAGGDPHGQLQQISVDGFSGFRETFSKDQYYFSEGYWIAQADYIEYKKDALLSVDLDLDMHNLPQDNTGARTAFETILSTLIFFTSSSGTNAQH